MPYDIINYIVLDANVLIKDFWMIGEAFSHLRKHLFLDHRPVVPEVAFLEARNQLLERAVKTSARMRTNGGDLPSEQRRARAEREFDGCGASTNWDVEALLARWTDHVSKVLAENGGRIVPLPDIPTRTIFERSLSRRKPFSNGDRGFRDTLIWLTTLDLLGEQTRVSFVSENKKDFFGDDGRKPHDDLIAEAAQKLPMGIVMLFHNSLDEFVSKFEQGGEAAADFLRRELISGTLEGFDLWSWVEVNLAGVLGGEEFDGISWAGFPYHAEAPVLREVEELVSLDLSRVRRLESTTYRLVADLSIIGLFDCAVGFLPFDQVVSPKQVCAMSPENDDAPWTDILVRTVGTFAIAIDFDLGTRAVVRAHAIALEHWRDYNQVEASLEKLIEEELTYQLDDD